VAVEGVEEEPVVSVDRETSSLFLSFHWGICPLTLSFDKWWLRRTGRKFIFMDGCVFLSPPDQTRRAERTGRTDHWDENQKQKHTLHAT